MFTTSRLLVVAGKGGVGKTTVTAAMARAAADTGLRVLVVTLDSRPGMIGLLGGDPHAMCDYEGVRLATKTGPKKTGSIHVRTITAAEALQDYLATQGMARLAKRLVSTGVVGVVSSAAPGIDDLLVLGKIKHLVTLTGPQSDHDLIILDGPAAGHAISFLQAPAAMAETVRGGPIRSQAIEVQAMLKDPERTRVVMVTLPETTPVNELLESTALLADTVGLTFAPVVVNGVDAAPDVTALVESGQVGDDNLGQAARFRAARCALHAREVQRIDAAVTAGHFSLPHIATAAMTATHIQALGDSLRAQISGTSKTKVAPS
ncbi:MAG: ArsA-related P-loop ATPase [Ilumatobacteraceae bacterium]